MDGSTTTGELASSDTLGENLEERYFVLDGLEYGVDAQFSCELGPLDPVGIGGAGALRSDSLLHRVLRNAKITTESILEDGRQS